MNPFVHPEFWLSFSFLIVLSMIVLPSIHQKIIDFFRRQQEEILDKIQKAKEVHSSALKEYHHIQKALKEKRIDKGMSKELNDIQKLFQDKKCNQEQIQQQTFQMRCHLMENQTKKSVHTYLLDQIEKKILNSENKGKHTAFEVDHFIKVLKENKEILIDCLPK